TVGKAALLRVGIARMIVERESHAASVQPVDELVRLRDERTPVVSALPAVVVPRKIEHEPRERNVTCKQARDLALKVLLAIAAHGGRARLGGAGEVFEVEVGDPGPKGVARDHRHGAAELRILLERLAVVLAVSEEIPVLTLRTAPRLDPGARRIPDRARAVIEQGVAAAAQQAGR